MTDEEFINKILWAANCRQRTCKITLEGNETGLTKITHYEQVGGKLVSTSLPLDLPYKEIARLITHQVS